MKKFKTFLKEYTQMRLASDLGIRQSAVSAWIRRGWIPAERVPAVAEISGISREELRPDIFK